MTHVDFTQPPPKHVLSVKMEREERPAELSVRLFKEVALFPLAVTFVAVIAWLCVDAVQQPDASADEKKWAMSVLSGATGGIVGYLVRR